MDEATLREDEVAARGGSLPRVAHRRRRSRSRSSLRSRTRVSVVYFIIAASWGFLTGSTAIVGGLAVLGRPLSFAPSVGGLLIAGALLAVAGGCVAALAHREAESRLRRGR